MASYTTHRRGGGGESEFLGNVTFCTSCSRGIRVSIVIMQRYKTEYLGNVAFCIGCRKRIVLNPLVFEPVLPVPALGQESFFRGCAVIY